MKTLIAIAVLSTALTAGCAGTEYHQGRNFDANKASTFQRGKTTRADVIAAMGEPTSSGRTADSNFIEYQHETVKAASILETYANMFRNSNNLPENRIKVCRFMFDTRTVLKDYTCSEGVPNYQGLGK